MMTSDARNRRSFWQSALRVAIPVAALIAVCILMGGVLIDALTLVFGAAVIAFLVEPLARLYEKKLSRNLAALAALLSAVAALALAAWWLLPALVSEVIELAQLLPESIEMVKGWLAQASQWLETHLPGVQLPSPSMDQTQLPRLAEETIGIAGNVADVLYRLSLMVVLAYFLLCDRARLMIRLELLAPASMRRTLVRMGNAVCRELKLYLRGQGLIAVIVGALAAVGLALVGVRSALVLGIIVGVLNMIPYFGPVLGGIPAVLMALGGGWQTAAMAVGVLWLVQQIDGALISPRIMSSLTGLSPAAVLLAIFVGSGLGGVVGMLLALPLLMSFRTIYRVFVQRHENV